MKRSPLPKPEFLQEIRLGVVVNGGISLAIYIYGICQEFYNAVRGRGIYKLIKALTDSDMVVDIISGTSAGGINGVLLSYALTNSGEDQIVDFQEFANLWRQHGDIRLLMHTPIPSQSSDFESLLDGDGYYQKCLEEAFNATPKPISTNNDKQSQEWVSSFNELDLFVTGTDVLGRIYQAFDNTGCLMQIKDHRTVFLLKHRAGRKQPFHPDSPDSLNAKALAKLCRITSCFPVAFPVVTVKLFGDGVDRLLVEWGELNKRLWPTETPQDRYQLHFVDGGVLDNRPFSHAIKEMYYHSAYRPVERKLFYIDPSPDRFLGSSIWKEMPKPSVSKAALDSLIAIPRYESIGNDLEQIKEHNKQVRRYKYQLAAVENWEPKKSSQLVTKDGIKEEDGVREEVYLRSRMVSLRDRVLPLILKTETNFDTDEQNVNIPGNNFNLADDKQKTLEKVALLLTKYVTDRKDLESRINKLQHFARQIRNLDVEYALRKHFFMVQKLCGLMSTQANLPVEDYRRQAVLAGKLGRQIKLLEVIRAGLERLLGNPSVSDYFSDLLKQPEAEDKLRALLYDLLLRLHRFFLDTGNPQFLGKPQDNFIPDFLAQLETDAAKPQELPNINHQSLNLGHEIKQWLPQDRITHFYNALKQRATNLTLPLVAALPDEPRYRQENPKDENDTANYRSMLRTIELASEALIRESGLTEAEKLLAQFRGYRKIDRFLYPSEYLTGVMEKELIQLVRISPHDAKLGYSQGKKPEDKLSGDALRAFGGFFKKSWRSNDILWGRLDGLNRLVETLVTPDSVRNFTSFLTRQVGDEAQDREKYIKDLIGDVFLLKNGVQPHSKSIARLQELLISLDRNFRSQNSLSPEIPEIVAELVSLLVEAGHRQIIETDLDAVVEDAITEQLCWNLERVCPEQEKSASSDSLPPPQYNLVKGCFDRVLTPLAVSDLAKKSFDRQDKETFFTKHYQVGSETISESIPAIILVNLASRAALVLRDMGLKLYRERNARSPQVLRYRSSLFDRILQLLYRFLNTFLQLFNWWVQSKSPAILQTQKFGTSLIVKLLVQFVALLVILVAVIVAIPKLYALAVSQVPLYVWLIVTVVAVLIYWLMDVLPRRRQ